MNTEKVSWLGKKVFVGIDVHRISYAITVVCDGEMINRWRMAAEPDKLAEKLCNYYQEAELLTAYEAGFSGFTLHRVLTAAGIPNYVVNAGSLEVAARDRVKTDRRDSLKLATQLSTGQLKSIRIPSLEQERQREVCRMRTQQIRNRGRIMNQTRMKLHFYGLLPATYRGVLRREFVQRTAEEQSAQLRQSLESLCAVWSVLDAEILRLTGELRQQAKSDELEKVYRSIPGIGPIAARIISTELGDMRQFSNEGALFSYTGLTPMEFSSGENRRQGHISRQGNSRLRSVLVECAWVAIRKDKNLKQAFDRIAVRAGKKRAIVAIARKLIGRARALVRRETLYELEHTQAA